MLMQRAMKLSNGLLLIPMILVTLLLVPSIIQLLTTDMSDDEFEAYYRDPLSTKGEYTDLDSPFVGIYSQLGSVIWFSGATIGLFSASIVYSINKRIALMLMSLAFMGLMLGADDLLLIHERLVPQFLHVGERYVILSYIIAASVLIWAFGRQIWEYDKVFLLVACLLFACSVAVDFFDAPIERLWGEAGEGILEDGTKLLGIVAYWTGVFKISSMVIKDILVAQYKKSPQEATSIQNT